MQISRLGLSPLQRQKAVPVSELPCRNETKQTNRSCCVFLSLHQEAEAQPEGARISSCIWVGVGGNLQGL